MLLESVEVINQRQKELAILKLSKHLKNLKGKTIAVWGLTFKPRTDDVREAAAITVIPALIAQGAKVKAYDPKGTENIKPLLPKSVIYSPSAFAAAKGADALILLTEWDEFRTVELSDLKRMMRGAILIDGRNVYSSATATKAGFDYEGVGSSKSASEAPSYRLSKL